MRREHKLKTVLNEIMEPYKGERTGIIQAISLYVDIFILGCILASCILILLDYLMPELKAFWLKCELFFTVIFIAEYLLRWYSAENRFKYPFSFYAVIDFIAIMPSLYMMGNKFMLFRLIRGARILRILKFARYNKFFIQLVSNLKIRFSFFRDKYGLDRLGRLFLLGVLALIIGANLLYITETKFAPHSSSYDHYWRSYWNIIIVLISGIEDKEPASLPGRIEVIIFLIVGICVVGMITGEIVSILISRIERKGKIPLKPYFSRMENHIVILGYNSHLDYIVRQIFAAFNGWYYILIVCRNAKELIITVPHIYKKVVALQGDPISPTILDKADIDKAYRAIVLSEEEKDDVSQVDNQALMKTIAVIAKSRKNASEGSDELYVSVQIQDEKTLKYDKTLNNVEFISSHNYLEKLLSQAVLSPGITEIYRSLMTFSIDSNEFYKIPMPDDFEGGSFGDAQLYFLNKKKAVTLIGICPDSDADKNWYINPLYKRYRQELDNIVIKPGDEVLVLSYSNPAVNDWSFRKYENMPEIIKKIFFKDLDKTQKLFPELNSKFRELSNDSVIICNCNKCVKHIAEELLTGNVIKKLSITLIVQDLELWENNRQWHPQVASENFSVIAGDPADIKVLENAGIKECGAAIILADPGYGPLADAPSALVAMAIEKLNPKVHTIMELIKSVNRDYIANGIIDEVICLGDITEKLIAQNCFFPGVINIFDDLLTTKRGTPQIFLSQVPEKIYGKTYKELTTSVINFQVPFIIIGFIKNYEKYIINPKSTGDDSVDTVLSQDDKLIIIGHSYPDIKDCLSKV